MENRGSGLNNFFSFVIQTKPSSRPHGLLVYGAVPSVSKVRRRLGKEVGQLASPFCGSRRCAQAPLPALSLEPRSPSPPGPPVPQHWGSREPSRAPPTAPGRWCLWRHRRAPRTPGPPSSPQAERRPRVPQRPAPGVALGRRRRL